MRSADIVAGTGDSEIVEPASDGQSNHPTEGRTTILIAARAGAHRAALAAFIEKRGHAVVFAENEADTVHAALAGSIDMVITGHTMPGIDGYALTRSLRVAAPELPVILISAGGPVLGGDLLECVMALGNMGTEERAAPPDTAGQDHASKAIACLTPREREVLQLVSSGYANKAVARILSISPRTVENHRAQIMRKTKSRCVADLVRLSLAAGNAALAAIGI